MKNNKMCNDDKRINHVTSIYSNNNSKKKKKGKKNCRNPGSNQGPLDLQSNALPTELFRLPGQPYTNHTTLASQKRDGKEEERKEKN